MRKLVVGACQLVQLGSIIGLTVIGLKRNEDCYKAEMKLLESEGKLMLSNIDVLRKEAEIEELKKELTKFKNQEEEA